MSEQAKQCQAEDQGGWPICTNPATLQTKHAEPLYFCEKHKINRHVWREDELVPMLPSGDAGAPKPPNPYRANRQFERMLAGASAGAPAAPAETAQACDHDFGEFVVCRQCGKTEAAALNQCHHCNDSTSIENGRCWWCLRLLEPDSLAAKDQEIAALRSESEAWSALALRYRVACRVLLHRHGVASNLGVTDDWLLGHVAARAAGWEMTGLYYELLVCLRDILKQRPCPECLMETQAGGLHGVSQIYIGHSCHLGILLAEAGLPKEGNAERRPHDPR